jgi:hypothetical protein
MDFSARPIHIHHREGVLLGIEEALDLTGNPAFLEKALGSTGAELNPKTSPRVTQAVNEFCKKVLAALVAPGVTYAELAKISDRAISRAFYRVCDQEEIEIPETRLEYLIELFPKITPTLKYCTGCHSLPIFLRAGEWTSVNSDRCTRCRGLFAEVGFTVGPRAWTTLRVYDPGTLFDEMGNPITDEAVLETLQGRGEKVHPVILAAYKEVDPENTTALVDLLEYLHHKQGLTPPAALNSLVDYRSIAISPDAVKVQVRQAMLHRGVRMVASDTDGTMKATQVPGAQGGSTPPMGAPLPQATLPILGSKPINPHDFWRRFYKTLCETYDEVSDIKKLAKELEAQMGRIDWGGSTDNVWFDTLNYFKGSGGFKPLLLRVAADHPEKFAPLVEGYLDMSDLRRRFDALDFYSQKRVALAAGVQDFLVGYARSSWDLWNHVEKANAVAALQTITEMGK